MNKLFALCLLATCVAMSSASCGILQRLLVKKEWADIFSGGLDRESFGTKLWREFFRIAPEARPLFDRVNGGDISSAKFAAHAQRVLSGLDRSIALLDDNPTLAADLAHLKGQHDDRGIAGELFDKFEEALLYVLPDYLGANFHDTGSWRDCFDVIKAGITG